MYAKLFQILASCMAETPKKVMGNKCFLCSSHLIPPGRVCVFGKSSVCISGVIKEAMEIDVSLFIPYLLYIMYSHCLNLVEPHLTQLQT